MPDLLELERDWRTTQERKLQQLQSNNAPKELIEHQESILKMTRLEYKALRHKEMQQFEEEKKEYIKANPLRKEVVDALYEKTNNLPYDYFAYVSEMRFFLLLNAYDIISENDSYYEVYDDIILHCRELYEEKYVKLYEKSEETSSMVH